MMKGGAMLSYQRLVLSSCRSSKLSPTTSKNWTTRCVSSSGNSEGVKEEEKKFDIASGNIQERSKLVTPKVTTKPLNFEEARDLAQLALGQQKKLLEQKLESLKMIFGGQSDIQRTVNQEWYYKKVSFWMKRYENFVGLTEVKAAQARVVEFERKFIDTQDLRREVQLKLADVQKRVKDIHVELEKTHRGEDRYLVLVTQEHQVLKEEGNLLDEFKFHEKSERENFSLLSNSVRDSHEKERAQAEKTKYWSVIGSVIGTCIGIFGTTINNRLHCTQNENERVKKISESKQFSGGDQGNRRQIDSRLQWSSDSSVQPGYRCDKCGHQGRGQSQSSGQDGGTSGQSTGEQRQDQHEASGSNTNRSSGSTTTVGEQSEGATAAVRLNNEPNTERSVTPIQECKSTKSHHTQGQRERSPECREERQGDKETDGAVGQGERKPGVSDGEQLKGDKGYDERCEKSSDYGVSVT